MSGCCEHCTDEGRVCLGATIGDARKAERDAIVKMIRHEGIWWLAAAIARGEHLEVSK